MLNWLDKEHIARQHADTIADGKQYEIGVCGPAVWGEPYHVLDIVVWGEDIPHGLYPFPEDGIQIVTEPTSFANEYVYELKPIYNFDGSLRCETRGGLCQ